MSDARIDTSASRARFKVIARLGDSRVDIGIEGFPGTVASEVHGNLGRELVKLANERIDQLNAEEQR